MVLFLNLGWYSPCMIFIFETPGFDSGLVLTSGDLDLCWPLVLSAIENPWLVALQLKSIGSGFCVY